MSQQAQRTETRFFARELGDEEEAGAGVRATVVPAPWTRGSDTVFEGRWGLLYCILLSVCAKDVARVWTELGLPAAKFLATISPRDLALFGLGMFVACPGGIL